METTGVEREIAAAAIRERSERQLGEDVIRACRLLVEGDEVSAIHIVPGRRPSYAELARFRRYADATALRIVMRGDGSLTLRVRPAIPGCQETPAAGMANGLADGGRGLMRSFARLTAAIGAWDAGFASLSEGVR